MFGFLGYEYIWLGYVQPLIPQDPKTFLAELLLIHSAACVDTEDCPDPVTKAAQSIQVCLVFVENPSERLHEKCNYFIAKGFNIFHVFCLYKEREKP
ncbi:hypothetical protein DUI87_03985 [Hirundo rustica rustica]|uniref:Uncharacterized protein n=1 Tax=Hirundo rustica rustica TaxID=333673 RepID=A0A3M0L1S0_HIRRU|nr:hypothetical protein DUI87_03985 [Hirundo rustica rustica]